MLLCQEEVDVMEITVVRTGGALVPRELEYYIEPNGEDEFYGSLNVIKFRAGEVEKKINVIARKDGVPEVGGLLGQQTPVFRIFCLF